MKAQTENADIVVGKTVIETEQGQRFINHFHDSSLDFDCLGGGGS